MTSDNMADSRAHKRSRARSPWSCSLPTILTATCGLLLLAAMLHSFTNRQLDVKGCRMPYMRAGYAKLHDFDTEHTRFASKYSVYLYKELGVDEDTRVGRVTKT